MQHTTEYKRKRLVVIALVVFAFAIAVLFGNCGPRMHPTSRPKYGEPNAPVGPDKSYYKQQHP